MRSFIKLAIIAGLFFPVLASAQTQTLPAGWSMVGNDTGAAINADSVFGNATTPTGISSSVTTVWTWNNAQNQWYFFSPSMTAQQLSTYAASKGYGVLSSVAKGAGFWVNAKNQFFYDPSITANVAPVANAGIAQNVVAGSVVTLDGSASSDVNSSPLTYTWTLTSKPAGSTATLSPSKSPKPTFTADLIGVFVWNLVVNDGKADSAASTVTITAATALTANFSSLIGKYEGDSTISVGVVGATLKITDDDFLAGTCIYTAPLSTAGNTVTDGTYQCSDFTTGSWTLLQMKIVDTSDIYILIRKNGSVLRKLYGMSGKVNNVVPQVVIGNIVSFAGQYTGISNNGPFLTDTTRINVEIVGSTLKITAADFFAKTCIYSGIVSSTVNSVSGGTYQCSDFTAGSWSLFQMKIVDVNDIYISIQKDGNIFRRMYGTK